MSMSTAHTDTRLDAHEAARSWGATAGERADSGDIRGDGGGGGGCKVGEGFEVPEGMR